MRLKKFNENNSRHYLNNGDHGSCPVCNNWKKISTSQSKADKDGMEYNYECLECNFKWYEQYVMVQNGAYELNTGEEIQTGSPIDSKSYDELKLQTKKYNI